MRLTLLTTSLLSLALSACGGGSGTDAGLDSGLFTPFDAGPPAFPDASTDSGLPELFTIRLAHQIPGMTGTEASIGSAHVCAWLYNGDARVPVPPQFLTQATGPIPFRGVSPYLPFRTIDPLDYLIAAYEPADLSAGCPSAPDAAGAPTPVVTGRVAAADAPTGSVVTALLTGLAPGTLGAPAGELPMICDPTPDPTPFDAACSAALAGRMIVVRDDLTPPASGRARVRVSNQLANIAPLGFNVCYEASLAPDTSMPPGACVDTDPNDVPEMLFANVTYGTVTEYIERAPITPTVPTMGFGGALYLVPETGASGCPPFSLIPGGRCLPVLAAFPEAPPSPNIQPQLEEGEIATIFITGALGLSGDDAAAFGSLFFMWQDNLTGE